MQLVMESYQSYIYALQCIFGFLLVLTTPSLFPVTTTLGGRVCDCYPYEVHLITQIHYSFFWYRFTFFEQN